MSTTPGSGSYMRSPAVPSTGKTFRRSPSFKAMKEMNSERRHAYTRALSKRRTFVVLILCILAAAGLLAGLAPKQMRQDEQNFLPDVPTIYSVQPGLQNQVTDPISHNQTLSDSQNSTNSTTASSPPVQLGSESPVSPGLLMSLKRFLFPFRLYGRSSAESQGELPVFLYNKVPKKRKKKKAGPLAEIEPDDIGLVGRYTRDGKDTCQPENAGLRLYMYELDPEYNFGLLNKDYMGRYPRNISDIPRYKGGMNLQHSPEYWLTVDLLTSNFPDRNWPCVAVRVQNPEDADLLFVPFFASLAYNKYTSELYKVNATLPEDLDRNVQLQVKTTEARKSPENFNSEPLEK